MKIAQIKPEDCYLSPINLKVNNDYTPPANTKPKGDSFSPSPQPQTKSQI